MFEERQCLQRGNAYREAMLTERQCLQRGNVYREAMLTGSRLCFVLSKLV